MKQRSKILLTVAAIAMAGVVGLGVFTRGQALRLISNPIAVRKVPKKTPADYQIQFSEVVVTNGNGQRLVAWYLPGTNGAAVLAQHGFRSCREEMLPAAVALHEHGYGVLVSSVRTHDRCDGEQITFGLREVDDLELWLRYLLAQPGVNSNRVGAIGNSMGGSLAIQLAARDARIKAVLADSAFSSADDTVNAFVRRYAGLPAFPFAPLMLFWARCETGCDFSAVSAKTWIREISPRPVLLLQGGSDPLVSRECAEQLYAAAREPRERWYEPAVGHAKFAMNQPAYNQRVTAFFDRVFQSN